MSHHQTLVIFGLMLCATFVAAENIESGPRAGTPPTPFNPVVVFHAESPKHVGKKWDFVEEYGARPFILIFARTIGDPLAGLLSKVDEVIGKHRDAKSMKALGLLVLLNDEDGIEERLSKFGERLRIKNISLAIDSVAGPPAYRLAREADLTVLVVNRRIVEANHALRRGELKDKSVKQIVDDLQKTIDKAGRKRSEGPRSAQAVDLAKIDRTIAKEPFKSGPQPGAIVPGDACQEPTVLVFARGLSEPVTSLVKRIDDKLIENNARELRCRGLVIWLSNDEALPAKVKALAHKQAPKRVENAFDNPDGWQRTWGIAKDAEVTIVLYVKRKVQASYTFRAGELDNKAIEGVLRTIDDRLSNRLIK